MRRKQEINKNLHKVYEEDIGTLLFALVTNVDVAKILENLPQNKRNYPVLPPPRQQKRTIVATTIVRYKRKHTHLKKSI